MENIVTIRDLKKFYDNGETKALNGINLDIRRGEFVSIIGPSGSGKSTLLNMIGALDKADSGTIIVDGIDLNDKKENLNRFRSEKIGFIFQLHNLIPNLNVLENIEIPILGKSGRTKKKDKEHAMKLLKSVGLEDKIKQKPSKMSGGQRQRVAIARALINNPSIIIADEPTGALDTKTSEKIMNLLKHLHEESNVTLIVVTHDHTVASQAERIITVRDGQIVDTDMDELNTPSYNTPDKEEELEDTPVDLVDYVTSDDIKFGTDIRKHIQVKLDNKVYRLVIRPLTSNEIFNAHKKQEEGTGTFQENIMQLASYSTSGKQIPLKIIQEKIPSGVVDAVSNEILTLSKYGILETN